MSDLTGDAVAAAIELLGIPGGALIGRMVRPVVDEHRRRISVALRAAEAATGNTREEIEKIVAQDPEILSLYIRVLYAAGNSGNDQTLRMLGETLMHTFEAPSRASENEVIVSAIEGLTRDQLLVLQACDDSPQRAGDISDILSGKLSPELVEVCLITLFTRGLMTNPWGRYGGGAVWELSPLGVALKLAAEEAR